MKIELPNVLYAIKIGETKNTLTALNRLKELGKLPDNLSIDYFEKMLESDEKEGLGWHVNSIDGKFRRIKKDVKQVHPKKEVLVKQDDMGKVKKYLQQLNPVITDMMKELDLEIIDYRM